MIYKFAQIKFWEDSTVNCKKYNVYLGWDDAENIFFNTMYMYVI